MLGGLEEKFLAIIADALAGRAHVDVTAGSLRAPAQGRTRVSAEIAEIEMEDGFQPTDTIMVGPANSPQSRRVLPLRFVANALFRSQPASGSAAANTAARARILDDVSTLAHSLNVRSFIEGSEFNVSDPDPGFAVSRFQLRHGASTIELEDGQFSASLSYRGEAQIWPVGPAQDEGVIDTLDTLITPLPLLLDVERGVLTPNTQTSLTGSLGLLERAGADETRSAASIAVSVQSDVPINDRGRILGGVAGAETGVRILPLGAIGLINITYRAPADDPGSNGRIEYVAVHLSTPGGERGVFLGLTPIRLVAAP